MDAEDLEVDGLFGQAAVDGDVDEMRALLAQGADVNSGSGYALDHAVANDHAAAVQFLLDNGADVNQRDGLEETVLHSAAFETNNEIVGLLLAAGADVNATDESGDTPLYFLTMTESSRRNRERCAQLLLSHGARLDAADRISWTPLHGAIFHELRDLVKLFLRAGAQEITEPDLPTTNKSISDLLDASHAAGGWAEYVKAHRRVLSSLVSKLSARNTTRPKSRPIPFDAASHVVCFWCPPGGY